MCVCVSLALGGYVFICEWVFFIEKLPGDRAAHAGQPAPGPHLTHTHKETSVSTASNTHDTSASTQKHTLTFTPLFQLVSQKQMLKDNIYIWISSISVWSFIVLLPMELVLGDANGSQKDFEITGKLLERRGM